MPREEMPIWEKMRDFHKEFATGGHTSHVLVDADFEVVARLLESRAQVIDENVMRKAENDRLLSQLGKASGDAERYKREHAALVQKVMDWRTMVVENATEPMLAEMEAALRGQEA